MVYTGPGTATVLPEVATAKIDARLVPNQEVRLKAHYLGAFLQDKWRVNNHLTLSLGLRYDLERIPTTRSPIRGATRPGASRP